jgi:hypothetical protein
MHAEDILSMRPDIAIWDARIEELSSQLAEQLSDRTVARLEVLVARMEEDFENPDPLITYRNLKKRLEALKKLSSSERNYRETWNDLQAAQQHRTRLVEVERKKDQMDAEAITAGNALQVIDHIINLILECMKDPVEQQMAMEAIHRYYNKTVHGARASLLPPGVEGRQEAIEIYERTGEPIIDAEVIIREGLAQDEVIPRYNAKGERING